MSVSRVDLIKHFKENGYRFEREGRKHTIYTNDIKSIPIKRHKTFDRIVANQLCKQAGIEPKF